MSTATTQDAFMLSRAEAAAVAYALNVFDDAEHEAVMMINDEAARRTPGVRAQSAAYNRMAEGLKALARRFELELAVRTGGGWWGGDSPRLLDLNARFDADAQCPDAFAIARSAVPALAEMLPWIFDEVEAYKPTDDDYVVHDEDRAAYERRRAALLGLAERLGVDFEPA